MTHADALLDIARAQLGIAEDPAGSNRVKYNAWYYGREVSGSAYPWCMAFVQWCCHEAGAGLPLRTASCGSLMRAAKKAGCWVTRELQPGDVAIYDFPGGAATDHCGIIERVDGNTVTAIEGNTSEKGSQSNGGMVCRRTRPRSQLVGAVRPAFRAGEEKEGYEMKVYRTLADVPEWYAPAVAKLVERGALRGDGQGNLNVSEDFCRIVTALDRFGTFS